jgi:hypothetical protein
MVNEINASTQDSRAGKSRRKVSRAGVVDKVKSENLKKHGTKKRSVRKRV